MTKMTKNLVITVLSMLLLASSIVMKNPSEQAKADPTMYYTYLRPIANGDLQQIYFQYPTSGNHTDKVDEEISDNGTTYVSTSPGSSQDERDLYQLADLEGTVSGITSVSVYAVVMTTYPNSSSAQVMLKSGGSIGYGSVNYFYPASGWLLVGDSWSIKPGGGNWTQEDVNALQAGIRLNSPGGGLNSLYCTQVYVVVSYSINAEFAWSPQFPEVGDNVTFDATSSTAPGQIVNYFWDFGDNTTGNTTNANISHIYQNTGDYTVTLTITDNTSLSDNVSKAISVQRWFWLGKYAPVLYLHNSENFPSKEIDSMLKQSDLMLGTTNITGNVTTADLESHNTVDYYLNCNPSAIMGHRKG